MIIQFKCRAKCYQLTFTLYFEDEKLWSNLTANLAFMGKTLKLLSRINFKTIYFNLKYFPFKTAIKLPVMVSRNVLLNKLKGTITINGPVRTALIQIGYGEVGVSDFKRSRAIWNVEGDLIFNGRAYIMHGTKINVSKGAQVIMGDEFITSTECVIVAEKKITFGNNVGLSWETLVMDTDFHHIYNEDGVKFNHPKEVVFGDNIWVGCRCTILKGSVIPSGSVIAATSMIAKKLTGDNSVFGGNPVGVLKSNITWKY